jgi:hypothetical protein
LSERPATSSIPAAPLQEVAFYYPGPVWEDGDLVKSLLLFFDGVSLLVPRYLLDKPERVDPAIVSPLREAGLLHYLEPESFVDAAATLQLESVVTELLACGALDELAKEKTEFHAISYSRLGWNGDHRIAHGIYERLQARGLALPSEDGVSIPLHPVVRSLVLVALSQILRPQGIRHGLDLVPVTDRPELVGALSELLNSIGASPEVSMGEVVKFDFDEVGVDLGPVPIDEVLAFRREHLAEHVAYRRAVVRSVRELSAMPFEERVSEYEARRDMLADLAADVRGRATRAFKKSALTALGVAGAVATIATGSVVPGLMTLFSQFLRSDGSSDRGAYSFLFRAARRFPRRP